MNKNNPHKLGSFEEGLVAKRLIVFDRAGQSVEELSGIDSLRGLLIEGHQ